MYICAPSWISTGRIYFFQIVGSTVAKAKMERKPKTFRVIGRHETESNGHLKLDISVYLLSFADWVIRYLGVEPGIIEKDTKLGK